MHEAIFWGKEAGFKSTVTKWVSKLMHSVIASITMSKWFYSNLKTMFCQLYYLSRAVHYFTDHKAGKIILLVVSVRYHGQRLSSRCHFSTGVEWSIVVLGFVKYNKKSYETLIRYTLKKHHRVFISRGVQNGCVCNLLFFRHVGHLRSIMLLIS